MKTYRYKYSFQNDNACQNVSPYHNYMEHYQACTHHLATCHVPRVLVTMTNCCLLSGYLSLYSHGDSNTFYVFHQPLSAHIYGSRFVSKQRLHAP